MRIVGNQVVSSKRGGNIAQRSAPPRGRQGLFFVGPVEGEPDGPGRQLDEAARYLNSLIADRTLAEAGSRLREELVRDRRELGELQARALALGAEAVQLEAPAVHIEGQASLLEDKALAHDLDKIRALFRALDEKERLLAVLDRTLAAQELRIFIGAESGILEPDLAIVAAPYRLKGEVVGALGVIGPTRMDYSRVVPLVELTARTVGLTLDGTDEE